MLLSKQEQQQINELAQQFEKRSGTQAVAAVIGKADDYPDIPWKAFALGAALAALAVVADELVSPDWASIHTPIRDVALILAAGIVCTVLAVTVPWFARLFLNRERAKTEVRQYAQGLFLQREIFKTAERVGILVLVCRFEHKIVILPDSGITRHVSAQELDSVIAAMAAPLKRGDAVQAFQVGFDALSALFEQKCIRPGGHGNELADGAIVEQGS